MVKNFDVVKQQLTELAEIVNSYKSEAVQLRLIELVLNGEAVGGATTRSQKQDESVAERQARRSRRKPKANANGRTTNGAGDQRRSGRSGGRLGAKAVLSRLHDEGFFKTPKTLNDIVQHADTQLATRLKQSDLSGPLARYTRNGQLTRDKNDEGQYEYTEPA